MNNQNQNEKKVLAIDLGSTSFKAAVYDLNLRELRFASRLLPHRYGTGNRVELDLQSVNDCLRQALAEVEADDPSIGAAAVTSQAQTFTLLDCDDRPIFPWISWQDGGDQAIAEEVARKLPDFGEHCSFGRLNANLQISQLARLKLETKQRVVPLPSYFLYLWSGRLVTDENIAAMSGLYSIRHRKWWNEALKVCGLNVEQLPEIVPAGRVAGITNEAAREFHLPVGIPLIVAGNDQTAGGYGARLDENRDHLLTLGTALVVYGYSSQLPAVREGFARGPYPKGGFYQMIVNNRGGNVINWAKTVLAGCDSDDRFFAAAENADEDCGGVVFDCGLKSGDGAWRNLAPHHTPAEMARSVVDSLAEEAAGMLENLQDGNEINRVLAAGGGRFRPLWMNTVARKAGVQVEPTPATPLLGAARMATEELARGIG